MPEALTIDAVAKSMRELATIGMQALKDRIGDVRDRAFIGSVVTNKNAIEWELSESQFSRGRIRKFLPLPAPKSGFHLALFRPNIAQVGDIRYCKIDVLMVTEASGKQIVGFRFERGDNQADTHAHPHVQLTRSFEPGLDTDWPDFTPQSYPAFPTQSSSIGETWLYLLVALYGLSTDETQGLTAILRDVGNKLKTETGDVLIPLAKEKFAP